MNKKHGFTLIELLAVIVVLAIIALIATPIVMNTIKRSKKGAAERSADNYVKQVEVAIASERLNGNILDGEYQITNDGNLCRDKSASCSDNEKIKIEMNGTKPSSGKIKITNGVVDSKSSNMTIGDYDVTYNSTKKTYEATEKGNGSTTTALCTANTTKVSALVWAGNDDPGQESSYTRQEVGLLASESEAYTPGVTYTCELGDGESNTFYVLEENGDNVSLIAGFNLGNTVAWCKSGDDNSCAADGAKAALKERTSRWTKLTESQISLPSASQIATAAEKTFDGTIYVSGLPTWLTSYTKFTSGTYGYWTSTPTASYSYLAWRVLYDCYLNYSNVDIGGDYGVRPVITVSKSNLS